MIVLAEPLDVLDGAPVSRIELIPPVHQRVYRMGLEHLGVVVGDEFDDFSRVHRAVLTGQQFQSAGLRDVQVQEFSATGSMWWPKSFEVRVLANAAAGAGSRDVVLESAMPTSG